MPEIGPKSTEYCLGVLFSKLLKAEIKAYVRLEKRVTNMANISQISVVITSNMSGSNIPTKRLRSPKWVTPEAHDTFFFYNFLTLNMKTLIVKSMD